MDLYLSHLEMLSAEAKLQTIDDEIAKLQALKPELEAMVAGWNESETGKAFAIASNKRAETKRQEQEIRDEYAAKIEALDYGDYKPPASPRRKEGSSQRPSRPKPKPLRVKPCMKRLPKRPKAKLTTP